MTTDKTLLDTTLAAANEMGERVRKDKAYMQQLLHDPVGTLIAGGVPPEAVGDVLRDEGLSEDEVQGYLISFGGSRGGLPGIGSSRLGPGSVAAGCIISDCVCTGSCTIVTDISSSGLGGGGVSSPSPDAGLRR